MRSLVLAALLFLLGVVTSPAGDCGKPPDIDFLLGFLSGDYRVVGQTPDSGSAYVGRLTLKESGRGFEVTRTIAGVTTQGSASIATAGEDCPVLKMRFSFDGLEYEATFLWRSDLDNHARLTGYVYRFAGETKSPGLEALFPLPPISQE